MLLLLLLLLLLRIIALLIYNIHVRFNACDHLDCSDQAQSCVYLVGRYLKCIQVNFGNYKYWGWGPRRASWTDVGDAGTSATDIRTMLYSTILCICVYIYIYICMFVIT